jgi:hypothetical protein
MVTEENSEGSWQNDPRQVDILPEVDSLPIINEGGEYVAHECPLGVAVVTHCCDLARGGKGRTHLAPICQLAGNVAREVKSGRNLQYIHLPNLGEDGFIDLGTIASADQGFVRLCKRESSVKDEESRHEVRQRIGRRFSRFAFPRGLNPVLAVLRKKVRDKAGKPDSNFGRVLDLLTTLRAEVAGCWNSAAPWDFTLLMVVEPGLLPSVEIGAEGSCDGSSVDVASTRILRAPVGTEEMALAWNQLAAALRTAMEEKSPGPAILRSLEVEVMDEDDLSYSRYRRTVGVDLDDLSEAP